MPISFSVIIPNYNHSRFLRQRIESVLQQTYRQFEIIIMDDGSVDNSREIIEAYRTNEKVKAIEYNQKNSGLPFLQWQKGIAKASNEWIWVAESDDYAEPTFLQEAAYSIETNPELVIFYTDGFIVDEIGDIIGQTFSAKKNRDFNTKKWSSSYFANGIDEINECLKFDCTINNASGMVFRKQIFESGLNEIPSFKYYGDWYFDLIACKKGNVGYSAKPLNYYRKHLKSHLHQESSIVTSRYEYFKILEQLYDEPAVTGKKELLDHFAYYYLNFGFFKNGMWNAARIISLYFRRDFNLALKVFWRITKSRISPKTPKISFS